MGYTVGWLKENMSAYELAQWMEYYKEKGRRWDEERDKSKGDKEKLTMDATKENFVKAFGSRVKKKDKAGTGT